MFQVNLLLKNTIYYMVKEGADSCSKTGAEEKKILSPPFWSLYPLNDSLSRQSNFCVSDLPT